MIELRFPEELLQEGVILCCCSKIFMNWGNASLPHMCTRSQLEILDPSKLYLHWSVLLNTEKSEEDLENVLMFLEEEE